MRTIAFAAFFAALCAGRAGAAVVWTKDGGRLEGDILSSTPSGIMLLIGGQRVLIGADKIQSIDYAQAAPSPQPDEAPEIAPVRAERRRWRSAPDALDDHPDMFSLDLGLAAPLSRVNFSAIGGGSANDGAVGPSFGLQYLHGVSPRTALGFEFHWYDRAPNDSEELLPASSARVEGDTLLLLGVAKFELSDRGWTRPYLLLGAGAHRSSLRIDAQPNAGFVWADTGSDESRILVDDAEWGGAFSARLGLDVGYPNPGVFSLEAGWTGLTSANYRASAAGQALGLSGVSAPINFFTFAARWGFRL
jgi:hypothetical protein